MKLLSNQALIKQKAPSCGKVSSRGKAPSREKAPSQAESQSNSPTHGPLLERQYYLNIIKYLSNPNNYNILFGAGKKTEVKGQSLGSTGSWNVFATQINFLYNQRTKSNLIGLHSNTLWQHFIRYRRSYAVAKRARMSTGSGCTDQDQSKGINTTVIKDKSSCPSFEEMDALFGEKADITVLDTMDSTVLILCCLMRIKTQTLFVSCKGPKTSYKVNHTFN